MALKILSKKFQTKFQETFKTFKRKFPKIAFDEVSDSNIVRLIKHQEQQRWHDGLASF